jgi:putative membrane protein
LGAFLVLLVATWWEPIWPGEQALHTSLTIVALGALAFVQRRWPLSLRSWLLVLVFLSLHTIAARWLYSNVPYDDWTDALFGFRLSDVFSWRRNHFDRLVHFTYGVCLAGLVVRRIGPPRAVELVVATSAVYELFEWGVAVLLAPDLAEAYNGQQGDMWDAHKDMALAALGSLLVALPRLRNARRSTDELQDNRPQGTV